MVLTAVLAWCGRRCWPGVEAGVEGGAGLVLKVVLTWSGGCWFIVDSGAGLVLMGLLAW